MVVPFSFSRRPLRIASRTERSARLLAISCWICCSSRSICCIAARCAAFVAEGDGSDIMLGIGGDSAENCNGVDYESAPSP